MLASDFLNFLLEDTLEEARLAYCGPGERLRFAGIERAIAECRVCLTGDRMARRLSDLLTSAREDTVRSASEPDQWFWFEREIQIEWIANVVSVMLLHLRQPTIVPPTRQAAMAAARLIGADTGD